MRYAFLFILLVSLLACAKAQTIAELEEDLPNLKDTARVKVLNKLAREYSRTDSAKSLQYSREAFNLSRTINFPEGVARSIRMQGFAYYFANNHQKFIELSEKSATYAEENSLWPLVSENYEGIAAVYTTIHANYSLSLQYYLKAYEVYEKHNPTGPMYTPLLGIASTYKNQNQYEKALEHIEKAIPLIEAAKDDHLMAVALENAADVYWLKKDFIKAKSNFQKSLELFVKVKISGGQLYCLTGLANIAREQNDLENSMKFGKEALALSEKYPQYDRARLYGLESMGKTYLVLKDYQSAQSLFNEALSIALRLKIIESIRDQYQELAQVSAAQREFEKAFQYQSKFSAYSDSVKNKEISRQLTEAQTRFETERKEAEIEILKRDSQISKFYFITAMASMIGLIIFGYLIIARQRLKNRKDRELAAIQNQMLEDRNVLAEVELKNKELASVNLRNELEFKNKELTTHTLNLIQKNESLENIKKLVEEMRMLPDGQLRPKLTNLINTVNYSFNLDRDWENFKLHFEKVHQGFFEKLMKDFQDLNGNDLKLCALMKLNMESKEIATVLDISPESVKVARHRLRKKLNLNTEQNLSSFLASF
jgi:tetratricopeptide (TPR) repeat protein